MKTEYTISWQTIYRILIAGVCIFLALRLLNVILMVIVSSMLAFAFHPYVAKLQKYVPGPVASVIVVLTMFLPLLLVGFSIIPNLIAQFPEILKALDKVLNQSSFLPPSLRSVDLSQYAQNIGSYLLQSTSKITNFVTTFLAILFLSLYFLVDSKRLIKTVASVVPDKKEKNLSGFFDEVIRINGLYIRGNLLISVICGVIIFLGLATLRVPFAAPLALFAAITDLLPLVGAVIGIIPAAIIGFSVSPTVGILTIVLFFVYQQFENNVVAPNVYNRALDISPALSFIAVIVGATLFGMIGAFISLPIAASVPYLVRYLKDNPLS